MKQKKEIYAICHNIRSLYNVGAIFRTANGGGVKKLYLTGYTGHPPQAKITKTALGAEKYVSWEYEEDIERVIKKLKEEKITIYSLENNTNSSLNYTNVKYKFPLALILGNEVEGLSQRVLSLSDYIIQIPMLGRKESLNVAVAFGIALYGIHFLFHLRVCSSVG